MERWDCLQSTKGGKRGDNSSGAYYINPCFCPSDGYCKSVLSGGKRKAGLIAVPSIVFAKRYFRSCVVAMTESMVWRLQCTFMHPHTPLV